jgi:hypothetical protein
MNISGWGSVSLEGGKACGRTQNFLLSAGVPPMMRASAINCISASHIVILRWNKRRLALQALTRWDEPAFANLRRQTGVDI